MPSSPSTRQRIIQAAAELIHLRGVAGTSVDDVLEASNTGKGQFYYYFVSKDQLVTEVVRFQLARTMEDQQPYIAQLGDWDQISDWLDALADQHEKRRLRGGCPIGSLAAEMADRDDSLRRLLAEAFDLWEAELAAGLRALQQSGSLAADADPAELAEITMAAIQGGYLLATTKRDIRPMRNALSAAYSHLLSFRNEELTQQ